MTENPTPAKKLHEEGGQLRESDQHVPALTHLTEAVVEYQKEKNYEGMVDALQDKVLTWKHLFLLSGDEVYITLAKKDAEAALAIAQKHNLQNKLGHIYFRLGETEMLVENYPLAVSYYEKSLEIYQGGEAEKGDFTYHLGEALYRAGDKQKGVTVMMSGLEKIAANAFETDPFLIHVWESGCHLRLAELLIDDDKEKAIEHYKSAISIIQSDPKLIIRKRQAEALGKKLGI